MQVPTSPRADALVGRYVSHFSVLARLGQGAQGIVYLAYDETLERQVALKFLFPQSYTDSAAVQQLIWEARAGSAATHPNNCRIHGVESAPDGRIFIVMGFYEGQTLEQRLKTGALPLEQAVSIAGQVSDGLAAAHARGVVHRDIMPANLLLAADGVKILDFGLARFAHSRQPLPDCSTLGTPAYLAPELTRGEHGDERSDVWSIGVMLYEMTTGDVPFTGADAETVVSAIRHGQPGSLAMRAAGVPPALEAIVFRALRKNPQQRFQSALDLSRALRSVQVPRASDRTRPFTNGSPIGWSELVAARLPA